MIRILLDEHVSPSLVGKLGDKGVFAAAATHVGLSGEPDAKIWNYAFVNDFVVVTSNARDGVKLYPSFGEAQLSIGIGAAAKSGDQHARSEMEGLLNELS